MKLIRFPHLGASSPVLTTRNGHLSWAKTESQWKFYANWWITTSNSYFATRYTTKTETCTYIYTFQFHISRCFNTEKDYNWLIISMAVFGKLGVSANWNFLYMLTSEVYPTSLRGTALTSCSTLGRIGGILAPFISHLLKSTNYHTETIIEN